MVLFLINGTVMERISNAMTQTRKVLALTESISAHSGGNNQIEILVLGKGNKRQHHEKKGERRGRGSNDSRRI